MTGAVHNEARQYEPVPLPGELQRLDDFVGAVVYQAEHSLPQSSDTITRAFNDTLAHYMVYDTEFQNMFKDILEDHPTISVDNLLRRTTKAFQAVEYAQDRDFYKSKTTVESWSESMEALKNDELYYEKFRVHVSRPIASNISDRGKFAKAVALLHELPSPLHIADYGSSLNDFLKRLALQDMPEMVFDDVKIMRPVANRLPGASRYLHDEAASQAFNRLTQAEPVLLGQSRGIDLVDPDRDKSFRDWAISCSRYLGELSVERLARQFEIFADERPANVKAVAGDVTMFDPASLGRKFNMVYLSTMLYQLEKEEVNQTLQNAEKTVEADGVIVVQDFVKSFDDPLQPEFHAKWHDWTYGVWVKDMQAPELGYQKYFTVDGGRVRKAVPEAALGRLPLAAALGLVPPQAS